MKLSLSISDYSFAQNLIKLDLSGQEINDKGMEYIAKALSNNKVIFNLFFYSYSFYFRRRWERWIWDAMNAVIEVHAIWLLH